MLIDFDVFEGNCDENWPNQIRIIFVRLCTYIWQRWIFLCDEKTINRRFCDVGNFALHYVSIHLS